MAIFVGHFVAGALLPKLATVESTMHGAPANVQAALATVNAAYVGLVAAVDKATSLQQMEAAFLTLAQDPKLKPAFETLKAYGQSQCGS